MIAMPANKPSEALMPMQGRITEDGSPIAATKSLAWMDFLQRRHDLEDFYWDKQHAA